MCNCCAVTEKNTKEPWKFNSFIYKIIISSFKVAELRGSPVGTSKGAKGLRFWNNGERIIRTLLT